MPRVAAAIALLVLLTGGAQAAQWAKPQSPVIPRASGYVPIPHAALMPQRGHVLRAIYDATRAADKPTDLLPALDMAGSELNSLGGLGLPLQTARFAVVFHGAAIDGILDDAHYRAKYKVANPNLEVLAQLRKAGVELFVCGQNLAYDDLSPKAISPQVTIALDALIVLMAYQNNGYALLSY